jgi:hypothetical protein
MKRVLLAVPAVLLLAEVAGAQCCGDCNGDGEVFINELIVAVNNNLNGCNAGPTPTPPPAGSCPIDFSDNNTRLGTPDCLYAGSWNQSCGDDRLATVWRSEGQDCQDPPCDVILIFSEFEGVDCGAEIVSPTRATLFGCCLTLECADPDFVEVTGELTLGPQGETLVMAPDDAPFTIGEDECPVTLYQGSLTEVVTPTGAAAQRRTVGDIAKRVQRLRTARSVRPPKPNLRRK